MLGKHHADITEQWLSSFQLPPNENRARIWDAKLQCFGVVVGRRRTTFVVQRRIDGESRTVTLGHWLPPKFRALAPDSMTVARARDAAIQALGDMRRDEDPRGEDAPAAQPKSPTFAKAMALHIDRMRKNDASPRSISTIEVEVDLHLANWKDRQLHEISRTDCREKHEAVTKSCGPYVANRVMRHVRTIWNTALKEHELPANPTIAVHWNKEHRRQEPIPWEKLPDWKTAVENLSPVRRDYQLVVLLTGIRRMDAATIREEHVDWKARTLTRPSPKGGKDRAFMIPLSRECMKILERRRRENYEPNGWLFPTDALKDRECHECKALGLPDHEAGTRTHIMEPKEDHKALVSPHRLRDTYTTALAALDPPVSGYAIDVLTNHRPPRGSVTAGYVDLSADDLRDAQERVTRFLFAKMKPKATKKPRKRKAKR